jgi:hypothetical protein
VSTSSTSSEEESKTLWEKYWEDDDAYGMTVASDGTLTLAGEAYYGFGVNYYSLFTYTYGANTKGFDLTYAKAGLDELAEYDTQIVRFNCGGYGAGDYNDSLQYNWIERYLTDKENYMAALKEIVDYAEQKHIGLIPSFFWQLRSIPYNFGEQCSDLGDTTSQSYAFMKEYTTTIVTAFKDSKAIMGWELGNEWNLQLELAVHDPNLYGEWKWMDLNDYLVACDLFDTTVNSIDTHHRFLGSGNAELRRCQYNQWNKYVKNAEVSPDDDWDGYVEWIKGNADLSVDIDTWEEHLQWQKEAHVGNFNMISEHVYDWPGVRDYKKTLEEYVTSSVQAAKSWGKCYYLGEFNLSISDTWKVYDGTDYAKDEEGNQIYSNYAWVSTHIEEACLTLIKARVQLTLFWNYDPQDITEGSFCTKNVSSTVAGAQHAKYGKIILNLAKKLNAETYPAALAEDN